MPRYAADAFVRALGELVAIPTVSADPRHAPDVRRGARWLARQLRRIGLPDVRIVDTPRHPVVLGSWRRAPGRPTVLLYGHYDVQPGGPFAMRHNGDRVHGRGVSDNKGQLLAHLAALEAWLRTSGALPVNVVCVLDGEEEIGSPNLPPVLAGLHADVAVVSDTRMLGPDQPVITSGLRGSVTAELELQRPGPELHSGTYGGAVPNPATALCRLVASLHRADGTVAIPGFYRDVQALHPALELHGIGGGYQGPGNSSIIPRQATAKLGIRLVPEQQPDAIVRLLDRHIRRHAPGGLATTLRITGRTAPVRIDPSHPAFHAATRAVRRVFGVPPVLLPSGGTIAAVSQLRSVLGLETVLLGFALPDDGAHGPNESAHLPTLFRAIDTCFWLLHELAHELIPAEHVRDHRGARVHL